MSLKHTKVFISHRNCEPDKGLAAEFYESLKQAGHKPFLDLSNLQIGENWSDRIDQELQQCDCLLLLLSPQAADSEMVIQEVATVRARRQQSSAKNYPMILPVLVHHSPDSDFLLEDVTYKLRGYLSGLQYREWRSPQDTPIILDQVLAALGNQGISRSDSDQPLPEAKVPSPSREPPSPSRSAGIKQQYLGNLYKQLDAAYRQKSRSSGIDKVRTQQDIDELEAEIRDIEREISR